MFSFGAYEDHQTEFTLAKSYALTWFSLTLKGSPTTPVKSSYLRFFNYHLNKLRDIGGLQKMHTAMEQAPQECPDFTGKPLGLKNCIAAFLVMMVIV